MALLMVLEMLTNDACRHFCIICVARELYAGVVSSCMATSDDDDQKQFSESIEMINLHAFLICPCTICSSSKQMLEIGYKYFLFPFFNVFLHFQSSESGTITIVVALHNETGTRNCRWRV